ncbi:hypothetical protein MPTK1_4g01920 [Marchantia polymorpha subsp. ruderalis]|uniref:Cardiolipin synthase N-terminal domain-containing protein n=2 Tax=Marchantia polymorpha TaxID=3197 RepID=A0A176VTF2_MARPO|nr:hypothetical protein AXG93_4316s1570 [Marchantia polymorpha subsp. ruderalis]PTQ32450.1 hypothetical protein MARPO_0098s0007 [Marchantia polymorpha]BBN07208.1 hypothetical protein Mp_4g01920 [Marchantia polymorpha subsp. ruderalis]|eukprot:PTQ32450.1 hypothetical protein MARPO_0098s0007 [Marchantia polymorpha]
MASVQALSILPPGSVFANPRWPGQSSSRLAEATFRIVGNHVGGSSRPARNLDYSRSPKRHIARSSRSSDLVSPSAPLVGLIGWTSQSGGFKSNFLFPIHVSSRVAENRLSSSFETRIQKPVFSRAAVSTKQENTVVTTEQGGGGGGMGGPNDGGGGGGRGGGDAVDWISSALIFSFWAGLLYYGAVLAPNQTSYRDTYFIEKLIGLHGDDGFAMNKVLTGEWLMMGLWPLIYTCLLIPSGRSRKGAPVGPFAALSVALGAFALLPYFGLWRPPPPSVSRDELSRWPLAILESKITAVVAVVSAVVLLGYVGVAGADQWIEFSQYFRESKFIHIMTIDFFTLATLCPFWVYNDLAIRKGSDNTSPLWALAFVPLLGPSLYLLLRPSLPPSMILETEKKNDEIST